MVADLTGMAMSNASLLDEATAAAEAMSMCYSLNRNMTKKKFLIDSDCHPQNIALVQTRGGTVLFLLLYLIPLTLGAYSDALGLTIVVGDVNAFDFSGASDFCGVMIQYPGSSGAAKDWSALIQVRRIDFLSHVRAWPNLNAEGARR
jgi:glycine dehydrogenase